MIIEVTFRFDTDDVEGMSDWFDSEHSTGLSSEGFERAAFPGDFIHRVADVADDLSTTKQD